MLAADDEAIVVNNISVSPLFVAAATAAVACIIRSSHHARLDKCSFFPLRKLAIFFPLPFLSYGTVALSSFFFPIANASPDSASSSRFLSL